MDRSELKRFITTSELPAGIVEFFSGLNIFFSITTTLGNILILIALKNVSSIHPPTKLFFRYLAVTDLCVGLMVQPIYATRIIFQIMKMDETFFYYVFRIANITMGSIFAGASVLISSAISVDRLLALLFRLRYRHVVTLKRVRAVITCSWIMAFIHASLMGWREDIAIVQGCTIMLLCLVISIFCYTRIYLKLRHQEAQVQNNVPHGQQNGEATPLNIAKYKKTVYAIMWVQLALVACYFPWVITAVLNGNGIAHEAAWKATNTLLYFNSSLNPILYCWKIREVKQAVKGKVRQLYCF